jgi:hypothetical protein
MFKRILYIGTLSGFAKLETKYNNYFKYNRDIILKILDLEVLKHWTTYPIEQAKEQLDNSIIIFKAPENSDINLYRCGINTWLSFCPHLENIKIVHEDKFNFAFYFPLEKNETNRFKLMEID